jgi:outer membrane immunogenic protein
VEEHASRLRALAVAIVLASTNSVVASPSHAADMPLPSAVPYASFSWTGIYAGLNAGSGSAAATATASLAGLSATASETLTGYVGGGQFGINWQVGPVVLGAEGDIQGGTQRSTVTLGFANATDGIDWFGTARARLGFAIDRWMPYVTAGWGYGGAQSTLTTAGAGTFSGISSHSLFVAGAGLEAVVWGNLSAKIEYLYLDTGNLTITSPTPFGNLIETSRVKDNIIRGGLNYRF